MKKKIETVLHPVRMRILQAFLTGEKLTAQQIKHKLPDVAVPTLYRHLNTLLKHEIITVVEENQIRGTVEKVYALPDQEVMTKDELEKATPDDHMNYFMTFLMSLSASFNDYIYSENADPTKDKLAYRQIHLNLSDEEFMDMYKKVGDVFMSYLKNEPNEDRQVYSISTIILPILSRKEEEK